MSDPIINDRVGYFTVIHIAARSPSFPREGRIGGIDHADILMNVVGCIDGRQNHLAREGCLVNPFARIEELESDLEIRGRVGFALIAISFVYLHSLRSHRDVRVVWLRAHSTGASVVRTIAERTKQRCTAAVDCRKTDFHRSIRTCFGGALILGCHQNN